MLKRWKENREEKRILRCRLSVREGVPPKKRKDWEKQLGRLRRIAALLRKKR